jgi:uncharacterized membrane protein
MIKVKKYAPIVILVLTMILLSTQSFAGQITPDQKKQVAERLNAFIAEFNQILVIISGFGAITSLLIFVKVFIRLGTNFTGLIGHVDRYKDIRDLAIAGLLTALFGGVALVLEIFYGTFFG